MSWIGRGYCGPMFQDELGMAKWLDAGEAL